MLLQMNNCHILAPFLAALMGVSTFEFSKQSGDKATKTETANDKAFTHLLLLTHAEKFKTKITNLKQEAKKVVQGGTV